MKSDYGRMRENRNTPIKKSVHLLPLFPALFLSGVMLASIAIKQSKAFSASELVYPFELYSAVLKSMLYYLPVALATFSAAGIVLIPLISVMRGYVAACAVHALLQIMQPKLAYVLCVLPLLVQLPGLFLLSEFSLRMTIGKIRRDSSIKGNFCRNRFVRLALLCIFSAILAAAAEYLCYQLLF